MGQISLQIPQVGSPISTEDPKISSDLSTIGAVINGNLDTNNLSPNAGILGSQLASPLSVQTLAITAALQTRWHYRTITAAGTIAANDGDYILSNVGAPVTVTLPSPTTAGQEIVVVAGQGQTTVTTSTGNIYYPASPSSNTSFTLGVLGSTARFVSDGANWRVSGGGQGVGFYDRGQVSVSFGAGISTSPVTVNHSLGVAPGAVQLTPQGGSVYGVEISGQVVGNPTSSSFQVAGLAAAAPGNGTVIIFNWTAFV